MADVAEPRRVGYTRMDEGTVEDYALAAELERPFMAATPERILAFMESLHHTFPGGRIDRYAHSLQTATRAEDAGECEEIVVAGLLHDIGDSLAPHNHADVGADVLRPYVSRHTFWMLKHHGIFQQHLARGCLAQEHVRKGLRLPDEVMERIIFVRIPGVADQIQRPHDLFLDRGAEDGVERMQIRSHDPGNVRFGSKIHRQTGNRVTDVSMKPGMFPAVESVPDGSGCGWRRRSVGRVQADLRSLSTAAA